MKQPKWRLTSGSIEALRMMCCPRERVQSTLVGQVVPFSPASGLLEWCEDTQPLGEYLLGGGRRTGGAHGRYHQPGQLTFSDALAQYNRDLSKEGPSDPAKRCALSPVAML